MGDLFLSPDIWSGLSFPFVDPLLASSDLRVDAVFNPTFVVISPAAPPFDHAVLTVANNQLRVALRRALLRSDFLYLQHLVSSPSTSSG